MTAVVITLCVVLFIGNCMAEIPCSTEQLSDGAYESPAAGFGLAGAAPSGNGLKRTIVLSDMINNVTRLETRVQAIPMVIKVTELLNRLRQIPQSDVEMLADGNRLRDNELIDSVLVANNIINLMLQSSDEELVVPPSNLGALVLASNDIAEYIRTHQRRTRRYAERQF